MQERLDGSRVVAGQLADGTGKVLVLAGLDRPFAGDEKLGLAGRDASLGEPGEELVLGQRLEADRVAEFG